jgi:hypothetical protein
MGIKNNDMKILIILIAIIFGSCSKGHDNQPKDNTITNSYLLNGTWVLSSKTSSVPYDWDGNGSTETDVLAVMFSCPSGYKVYFNYPSMTGNVNKTCSIESSITWSLSDYGNTLNWTIPNAGTITEKIVSISSTQLKTITETQPPNATIITITNIYTKK